jgi:hypothetical protein
LGASGLRPLRRCGQSQLVGRGGGRQLGDLLPELLVVLAEPRGLLILASQFRQFLVFFPKLLHFLILGLHFGEVLVFHLQPFPLLVQRHRGLVLASV